MSRNKKAINKLHELGVCISCDCILQIYKNIDNQVCDKYNEERGAFSTLQFDNINKQCYSTTAKSDFNGPGFSVACHVPEKNFEKYRVLPTITQNVKTLPHSYTAIEQTYLMKNKVFVPKTHVDRVQPSTTTVLFDAKRK